MNLPTFFSAFNRRQSSQSPDGAATASVLASQWANPTDVTTVLMVIGGDVVQKALAQTTGCWYTPVCFSFGWVAYSFMALVSVLGDGRLLPAPDVDCRVINLDSGYTRDNKNWVVGRLLRDLASSLQRDRPLRKEAIRISVWEALDNPNGPTQYRHWAIHAFGLFFMFVQLAIAAIPQIWGDWGVLLVTGVGTFLCLIIGMLPQWTAEKLPNGQDSKSNYALTVGNGARDVVVILGMGKCLNLEKLSTSETPRNPRPWKKFVKPDTISLSNNWQEPLRFSRNESDLVRFGLRGGMPLGFHLTFCVCILQAIMWLLLLITVSALQSNSWFLMAIGFVGMFQNAYLAAMEIKPEHRNIPLRLRETIFGTRKVMDGIMDLHVRWGCGEQLMEEFFPGRLRPAERAWWDGDTTAYDKERMRQADTRGVPRTEPYQVNLIFRPILHPKKSTVSIATPAADSPLNEDAAMEKHQSPDLPHASCSPAAQEQLSTVPEEVSTMWYYLKDGNH